MNSIKKITYKLKTMNYILSLWHNIILKEINNFKIVMLENIIINFLSLKIKYTEYSTVVLPQTQLLIVLLLLLVQPTRIIWPNMVFLYNY